MNLQLVVDIVMTFLLAGTIYFAWRLSDQIGRFRNSRSEMDRLVRELNMAVDRSASAILSLRETAQNSGEDLQKTMRAATELSDELQIMTESANAMAARLERAVGASPATLSVHDRAYSEEKPVVESVFNFSIRDPEFSGGKEDIALPGSDDEWGSDAERELFRAIQKNKKPTQSIM